jgi:hypothetical protein
MWSFAVKEPNRLVRPLISSFIPLLLSFPTSNTATARHGRGEDKPSPRPGVTSVMV